MGCSFFYPGQAEEIVPQVSNVVLGVDTLIFNPLLEEPGVAPYGLHAGRWKQAGNLRLDGQEQAELLAGL